jgi:hypothetical protein
MLAEVAEERAKALADINARRGELVREEEAMQTHQAMQEGHAELNIGGYRFQTSVQTQRAACHTRSSTPTSAVATRRMCVMTAASSWTATASTLGTSWIHAGRRGIGGRAWRAFERVIASVAEA